MNDVCLISEICQWFWIRDKLSIPVLKLDLAFYRKNSIFKRSGKKPRGSLLALKILYKNLIFKLTHLWFSFSGSWRFGRTRKKKKISKQASNNIEDKFANRFSKYLFIFVDARENFMFERLCLHYLDCLIRFMSELLASVNFWGKFL